MFNRKRRITEPQSDSPERNTVVYDCLAGDPTLPPVTPETFTPGNSVTHAILLASMGGLGIDEVHAREIILDLIEKDPDYRYLYEVLKAL